MLYRGENADVIPLETARLTFGRGANRDVIISGLLVSSRHAVPEQTADGHYLSDVQTETGTRQRQADHPLPSRIRRSHSDRSVPVSLRGEPARPDSAVNRNCCRSLRPDEAGRQNHSTGFKLLPGEFVGLIGPSGVGKTTLLDALNGLRPATSGDVFLNDDPLYDEYSRLRHHIGYVPQDDIIHRELTVGQALTYAARLGLPADTNPEQLARVIEETLDALDLSHRREVIISQLSGVH